ncbi:hypothetical protein DBR06_SOUSAS3410051, partial [Sousa chinensis]
MIGCLRRLTLLENQEEQFGTRIGGGVSHGNRTRSCGQDLHGGGAGSFQSACAEPVSRRHFVWAAVAAGLPYFMFLARRERNLYPVDSFNCGNHPPFPPGQHLVKIGRVAICQKGQLEVVVVRWTGGWRSSSGTGTG